MCAVHISICPWEWLSCSVWTRLRPTAAEKALTAPPHPHPHPRSPAFGVARHGCDLSFPGGSCQVLSMRCSWAVRGRAGTCPLALCSGLWPRAPAWPSGCEPGTNVLQQRACLSDLTQGSPFGASHGLPVKGPPSLHMRPRTLCRLRLLPPSCLARVPRGWWTLCIRPDLTSMPALLAPTNLSGCCARAA